ncbi:MAG: CvpA family protein [Candidatus Omnitrophota bacterium]|nr:CvpA family protein [Candidatus Omnitrophota bacterium]
MNFELLKKLNWVDICVFLFIVRTLYIGLKRGLVVEFFKLLGVYLAIVISFHYYARIANFLNSKSPLPLDFADFLSLLVLAGFIILVFKFIREGFTALIKAEAKPVFDKWAGFIFSLLRAFLLSSLVIVILFISNITYVTSSITNSFSQNYFLNLAPRIYSGCFENLIVKLFPSEQLNQSLFDSLESAKENK